MILLLSKERCFYFGTNIAYRMNLDVIERMSLSEVVFGGEEKRKNIFLKLARSVKFFNTNPYPELKSTGGFL